MTASWGEALARDASRGFNMRGWDFTAAQVQHAIAAHRMLNPAFELGTNACPWNCSFCFTEDPANPGGAKRRLATELSLERRLRLVDEAAALGARTINIVGAGEPTLDPHFWELVDRVAANAMVPIVYTEGSRKLVDDAFVDRLYGAGATVVLKVNSLWNVEWQDAVVRGPGVKRSLPTGSYTEARNRALDRLLARGFAAVTPTRLAFDTILCRENVGEIERLHRYTRDANIFLLLVNYLPSGRGGAHFAEALSLAEQEAVYRHLADIDRRIYGIARDTVFPYAGSVPCTIRGLGLHVKITGECFDCPGESEPLGSVAQESLATVWERARPITAAFDGGCLPRKLFEARRQRQDHDGVGKSSVDGRNSSRIKLIPSRNVR